eukprot:2417090-Lingulodinium_polyedra.AAC.1
MTGPRSAPNCHEPSRFDASTGEGPGAHGTGGGGAGAAASVDASSAYWPAPRPLQYPPAGEG